MKHEPLLAPLALCALALTGLAGAAQAWAQEPARRGEMHAAGHQSAAPAHAGGYHPAAAAHENAHHPATAAHDGARHTMAHAQHDGGYPRHAAIRAREAARPTHPAPQVRAEGGLMHAQMHGADAGHLMRVDERREHDFRGEEHDRREHRDWHGDIHAFHEHDLEIWRGGRWFHGGHEGRRGWWWIVGGVWYFYPAPVYPYPDPYQPPVVTVTPEGVAPPHYLYYCGNPSGYYPYVARCFVSWQRVVSAPPAAVVGVPPPAEGYPPPGAGVPPPQ